MARFDGKVYGMGYRNGCDGGTLGLDEDNRTIEQGSGGTHPGAQYGAVSRGLMMGMVSGMLDRLRLSESTDRQDTKHNQN